MGGAIESRRIQKLDFGRGQLVENPISRSPIRLERLLRSEFARAAIFFCLWGMIVDRAGTASAEHPQDSPGAAVADPSASQVESLAMLIQIVDELETYVRRQDLASIHSFLVLPWANCSQGPTSWRRVVSNTTRRTLRGSLSK